ncbi:MAG TPA: DNA-processing protein DprA, partial [Gammaproteobacteria bacterium]
MDGEEQQLRYWLALLQVKGIGPVQFRHLWQESGGLERLFEAPPAHLPEGVRQGLRATDWEAVDSALSWREQPDCHILTLEHPAYPPQLKEIHDAPPLLFVRGDVAQLSNPQLAMVGSRNPGVVGRETAHDFGRSLVAAGLVITSGLAQGIDTASHQGALAGDGQSVAVFGTGPDRVYPAQNRELAHAIVAGGGALVSEYSPGVGPQP